MTLTAQEQAKLVKTYATVSIGTAPAVQSVKVWGTVGLLQFLGMTPVQSGTLADNGLDRTVTRRSHNRSRWLGDRTGSSVNGNTATQFVYPSRKGNAVPGTPIKIVNLSQKVPTGGFRKYTLSVEGDIGTFIAWYTSHAPAFPSKIIGKTGNAYVGTIPAD